MRSNKVQSSRGSFFAGSKVHELEYLPASDLSSLVLGQKSLSQRGQMVSKRRVSASTTASELDGATSDPSLRPNSLFHGSKRSGRSDPFPRPSCVPSQTCDRDSWVTETSTTSTKPAIPVELTQPIQPPQIAHKKSKSMASMRRARNHSIFSLFQSSNAKPKPDPRRHKSLTTNLSLFSGFSGTHFYIEDTSTLEICRPLEKAVDPRISRPFMPFASGRTVGGRSYGPADIRVINVPPPNTPNPGYQAHEIQSQHASPVDDSGLRLISETPSRHTTFIEISSTPWSRDGETPSGLISTSFWHQSTASTRKSVFIKYARTLFILLIAIFLIVLMGTAALSGAEKRISNIAIAIVDLDNTSFDQSSVPIVGPYIRAAFELEFRQDQHLNYEFPSIIPFQNDVTRIYQAVYDHDYWAAVIIQPNATQSLLNAFLQGNTSYDPSLAATIVYNKARDSQTYGEYVMPKLDHLALEISSSFEAYWSQSVSSITLPSRSFPKRPQILSPGISFSFMDLSQTISPTTSSITTINVIYLILISFYSCTFFMHTHILFVIHHPSLKFSHLIIYRYCATMTAYFFFALAYSLIALTLQVPVSHSTQRHDPSGLTFTLTNSSSSTFSSTTAFLAYFSLNFLGTTALGIISENMAMLLSLFSALPYSLLFLLFWMASNIATSLNPLDLAGAFYKWGYAWPMYNVVEGTKTLVLGMRSNLTTNFAVLGAWVVLGTVVFPLACWMMRWRGIRVMGSDESMSSGGDGDGDGWDVERMGPRAEAMA